MLVGATEIGGSRPAPSRVTSKASTTTKASPEDVFAIPVTSITSVWLPAPSRGLVYMAVEAAGRVGAKVSTVSTRVPSIQTVATPQTSHGTPIHRTAVRTPGPPNVRLAVAPAAEAYPARSPLSATPELALVVSSQAPAGASVAAVSSERAR